MALLEFLSRSAPARLVSSRQLARSGRGGWAAIAARARGRRAPGARLRRLALCFLFLFGLFCGSHGHSENRLGDPTRDTRFHLFEEAVRLALVGDERVLLAVTA